MVNQGPEPAGSGQYLRNVATGADSFPACTYNMRQRRRERVSPPPKAQPPIIAQAQALRSQSIDTLSGERPARTVHRRGKAVRGLCKLSGTGDRGSSVWIWFIGVGGGSQARRKPVLS